MPFTSQALGPVPGVPGLNLTNNRSASMIRSITAGVIVPPGSLVEVYAGSDGRALCRPVRSALVGGAYAPQIAGVAMFDEFSVEQSLVPYQVPPGVNGSLSAGYPVGYAVPVIYQGSVWGIWDGNTSVPLAISGPIQVWHSSDGSTMNGVFTTKPAQTTVGSEIDAAGSGIVQWDPWLKGGAYTDMFGNVIDIVALNINLPGKF